MLAFGLEEESVKNFMNRLLREDIFDAYEVRGVELSALTRISISGEAAADTEAEKTRKFLTWAELRPLIRSILQNGAKPRLVKIVFAYGDEQAAAIHPNAAVLFLNLLYENGGVTFTTATGQKQFSLDKTLDADWDGQVTAFFNHIGVNVIKLS